MAILDTAILSEIQRVTLENLGDGGALWPSGMWTQAEVLGYLNQRQNRFLAASGLMWKRDQTAITINQANQPNPSDWIATVLVAYMTSAGLYKELPSLSPQELDLWQRTWPGTSSATPVGYYEQEGETLTTFIAPIPTDAGSALERYYVHLGTALTAAGVNFSVPDEYVPTIKYGCLAEMFGKVGEGFNPLLRDACEERWQEGLAIAELMAKEGWFVL